MSAQPFDIKAYRELLKAKGMTDEDLAPFTTGQLTTTSEFSKYQAEHKKAMEQVQQERAQVQAAAAEVAQYEAGVREFESRYGPRSTWPAALEAYVEKQNPNPQPTGITEQVFDQRLNAALAKQRQEMEAAFQGQLETIGQGSAAYAEFVSDAREHWKSEYGTTFPKDDFRKFYVDNGHTNPHIALTLFESPHKAEKEKKEWEAKLEQARLEGAQSVRSQLGVVDGMGIGAGGWAGDVSISVGAADSKTADPNAVELTRDQQYAKWSQGFDKQLAKLNADGGMTQ